MTTSTTTKSRSTRGKRPALTPAERARRDEQRREKVAAARAALEAEIASLTNSQQWRAMLAVAARLHTYSWRNCLMILARNPQATRVAGYRTWQTLGRQVRRGEPGIPIWAHYDRWVDATDTNGAEDGDNAEPARIRRDGWKVEHVWDISQTDGPPLPEITPTLLTGSAPTGLWDAFAALVHDLGYTLRREATPGAPAANGSTTPAERAVRVSPDLDDAQAVKTLAHELAHIRCGHTDHERHDPRSRIEVEAESVAYIVCTYFGLDATGYSLAYVAGWAEPGKETDALAQTAETVVRAARQIITDVEAILAPSAELLTAVGQ